MPIFKHNFVPQLFIDGCPHLNASEHADVAPDGGVGVVGDVAVRGAADLLGEAAAGGEVEEGAAGGVADHVVAVLVDLEEDEPVPVVVHEAGEPALPRLQHLGDQPGPVREAVEELHGRPAAVSPAH